MDMIDPETREQILNRTLEAADGRRLQRARRSKMLGAAAVSCLVGLAGIGVGLLVGRGGSDGREAAIDAPWSLPREALGSIPRAPAGDVVAVWAVPSALILVVNENGIEMKALNDAQVAALVRKPDCEFALTPDAVMWVSEYGIEGDAFSPGVEF